MDWKQLIRAIAVESGIVRNGKINDGMLDWENDWNHLDVRDTLVFIKKIDTIRIDDDLYIKIPTASYSRFMCCLLLCFVSGLYISMSCELYNKDAKIAEFRIKLDLETKQNDTIVKKYELKDLHIENNLPCELCFEVNNWSQTVLLKQKQNMLHN